MHFIIFIYFCLVFVFFDVIVSNLMQLFYCYSDFERAMPWYHDEVHSGEDSSIGV